MHRRAFALLTLLSVLGALAAGGCGGDVDTEPRTLSSGRRIDVFRIFTTGSEPRMVLHFFYITRHFDSKVDFDQEWAEVTQDAQQEADKRNAVELVLIGSRPGAGLLSLASRLVREHERGSFFRKRDGKWVEVTPPK
jgi:hypothetical protein